jgi:hypothetical protein
MTALAARPFSFEDEPWTDPDHPDPLLDAAYRGGIRAAVSCSRPQMAPLEAALDYAARGWSVFPCHSIRAGACSCGNPCTSPGKHPRTVNGCRDATRDPQQIRRWWRRWPDANPAIATGEGSGIFTVDVDTNKGGDLHFARRIARQGPLPDTCTNRTGGGGWHFIFSWPDGADIRNSTSQLAHGVDVRGNGGYIMAPPANHISGGFYEIEINIDPVAAPDWLIAALTETPQPDQSPRPIVRLPLTRYGEVALDKAVDRIRRAPDSEQRDTLNREVFAIAGLVAGGVIPAALAREALHWAARQMPSYDPRRPWRPVELKKLVDVAFLDGLQHPRRPDKRRAAA